ncbi:MAG: ATP-dependent protease ATPase subunit HslU, partial [Eubacteriales bacterium]|nr:ATP-dependent protease ATPase subunit HslU [Eubacteriales bacterium]
KNIIMKGPTGVGKTEIARRLAKLVKAPFIKIEATKYTEVGYVGRDVESMVRDLVETSVRMVKDEKQHEVEKKAKVTVDKILLDAIYKSELAKNPNANPDELKEKLKVLYDEGKLDEQTVEIEVQDVPKPLDLTSGVAEINLGSMLGGIFPQRKKRRKLSVLEARELLTNEECDKMIDMDSVNSEAIKRAEEEGIIFIDEIDKVIGKAATSNGPDVSREGVQRDILPIVEGSTVATKYGNVKTDFILFIASGAFHVSKIEDMIPELQGRFPIKVELKNLTKDDFYKILTETKTSVTTQYAELLKIDNIDLDFTDDALKEIAEIAEEENETNENIGARRLHSIIEKVLEDISFNATGENPLVKVVIDKNYVQNAFGEDRKKYDLKKYVL